MPILTDRSTDKYLYSGSRPSKAKKYYFLAFLFLVPIIIFGSFWYLDSRGFFAIENIDMKIEALESQKSYSSVYVEQLSTEFSKIKGKSLWRTSLSEFTQILFQ